MRFLDERSSAMPSPSSKPPAIAVTVSHSVTNAPRIRNSLPSFAMKSATSKPFTAGRPLLAGQGGRSLRAGAADRKAAVGPFGQIVFVEQRVVIAVGAQRGQRHRRRLGDG